MASFMKLINITSRCATQYRGERLADTGLKGCHIEYILTVCRLPGITQDQLAQTIHVNGSNVTRQLALLEDNGFVERRQSMSDKRAFEVFPTDKAIAALPHVREVLRAWNEYLTEDFTGDEKAVFQSLMERVAAKAESYAATMKKGD